MLSSAWLILPILFANTYSVIIAIIIICLLTDFSGQKFRDDLIISAGNDVNLIKTHSALSLFQRNFIFFLSPILLSLIFAYTPIQAGVLIILSIQLALYLIHKLTQKESLVLHSESARQ